MSITLPSEVLAQLPSLQPEKISAYLKVSRGLQDFFGETHLVVHEKRLSILTRGSLLQPLSVIDVSETVAPRLLKEGFEPALIITTKDGKEHTLPVLLQEQEAQALLSALSGESPSAAAAPQAPPAISAPLLSPMMPLSSPPPPPTPSVKEEEEEEEDEEDEDDEEEEEDEDDNEEDEEDEDEEEASIARAIAQLKKKEYAAAIVYMKEAMGFADEDDQVDYQSMIRCVELLMSGEPVEAFFENYDGGYVYKLSEAVSEAIADALEARGETILAIASLEDTGEEEYEPRIKRLRAKLHISEDEEQQKLSERYIEWYQRKVDKSPNDAEGWANLASHQNDAERYDEALESARRSILLAPKSLEGYLAAAEAMRGKEDYQGALSFLERASEENPTAAETYRVMAEIQSEDLYDTEAAIKNYQKAIHYKKYAVEDEEDELCALLKKEGRSGELKTFLQERIAYHEHNQERKEALTQQLSTLFPGAAPRAPAPTTFEPPSPAPRPRLQPLQRVNPAETLPQKSSSTTGWLLFLGFLVYVLIRFFS